MSDTTPSEISARVIGIPSASASSGKLLIGKSDINGRAGIQAVQPDGSPILLGGGEIVMNEKASTKYCEKLSEMNKSTDGVAFDCAVQKVANTDRASGNMPKDEYENVNATGGTLIASAPTRARLEKSINDYFYSTTYKIVDGKIYNSKGLYERGRVEEKNGRHRFIVNAATGIQINIKPTKNEINNIVYGVGSVTNGAAIQAATSYLRAGESAGPLDRIAHFKRQDEGRLIDYIHKNNLWMPLPPDGKEFAKGGEAKVYLYDGYVVKINYARFYDSWKDYFNSLLLHNYFFPITSYELIGFSKGSDDVLYAIVKQSFIEVTAITKLMEIRKVMSDLGFTYSYGEHYINKELGIEIKDIHEGNVLNKGGVPYFIDTIFYLKETSSSASPGTKVARSREYVVLVLRIWNATTHAELDAIATSIATERAENKITHADEAWLQSQVKTKTNNMKIKKGDLVTIPTSLTTDPYDKKGEQGFIASIAKNGDVAVRFNDDTIGIYQEDVFSSAAAGTKTTPMNTAIWQGELYYLKLHNIINEPSSNKKIKIVGYTKDGLRIEDYSILLKDQKPTDIDFITFARYMEEKAINIEGCPYENERDKVLLQNEINGIVSAYESDEKAALIADSTARAEVAEVRESLVAREHEAHKAATDDTIAGMEAMAGGERGHHCDHGSAFSSKHLPKKGEKVKTIYGDVEEVIITTPSSVTTIESAKRNDWFHPTKVFKYNPRASKGASIPNNYKGKDAEEVWNTWTEKQRVHFLNDHENQLEGLDDNTAHLKYSHQPDEVRNAMVKHIYEEQYAGGARIGGLREEAMDLAKQTDQPQEYIDALENDSIDDVKKKYKSMMAGSYSKGARIRYASKKQKKMMKQYAKMCGYDIVPAIWTPMDYTEKGWRKLIKEGKANAAGGKKIQTQNYKVSYTKKTGGDGEVIVKGIDEKNALNNAKNTTFTGKDFKVIGVTEDEVTNKGNKRGQNRAN